MTADQTIRLRRIYVEISNVCNLKCSFCPEVGRPAKEVSVDDFADTLEKIGPYTDEIYLHLMGEPLGHPRFAEIVARCEDFGIAVKITTNGTLLGSANTDILLSPSIRQVNFSLHSFPDNFPGRSVSGYMGKLLRFARQAMALRPDLYINFRLWDLSEEQAGRPENQEIRALIEQEFAVDLTEQKPDIRRRKNLPLAGRIYAHFDSRFVWPSLQEPLLSERGRCQGLLTHVGIHADGTVVPCCLDKDALLPLGNIRTQSLPEVLNSDRALRMRSGFLAGKLTEDLCRRCSFATRFRRKIAETAKELHHAE